MIPYILHQTWKTKTISNPKMQLWRNSFFELNKDIGDRFYDDADNYDLVAENFNSLIGLYKEFPKEIFRVDFARLIYLFLHGGLYADLDCQCLTPLSDIFSSSNKIFLGQMGTDDYFSHCIPNVMMASAAKQAFWLGYLRNIELAWRSNFHISNIEKMPESITGPIVLRDTVMQYQDRSGFQALVSEFVRKHHLGIRMDELGFDELVVLPGHVWYPLNWNDPIHWSFRNDVMRRESVFSIDEARKFFPHSMAVTYWAHSW